MTGFEYALGLFSVVIGLALGEIATDIHRLIRHCRTIRWDGRVILSTALVVIVTVRMWFAIWTIKGVGMVLVFPFYLSLFVELMILFMLGATCLPEEPPTDCDLGDYYEGNQRLLWTLFGLFQTSFFGHWLYFGGTAEPPLLWLPVLVPLIACVLLALVRKKWLHLALPALLIALELYENWDRALGARAGG